MAKKQVTLEFTSVGQNDHMIYQKADIAKACMLGGCFAISFYQVDYQAVANMLVQASKPNSDHLLPVSKVVMDIPLLDKLIDELLKLKEAAIQTKEDADEKG